MCVCEYACVDYVSVCVVSYSTEGSNKVKWVFSPVNLPGIDCFTAQSAPPLEERKNTPVSDTAKKYTFPPIIADIEWN